MLLDVFNFANINQVIFVDKIKFCLLFYTMSYLQFILRCNGSTERLGIQNKK